MTTAEFNEARKILARTDDQLAADLDVTPDVVRAWADGRARVPKRHARLIQYSVAAEERQSALRASGLPECEWMRKKDEELEKLGDDDLLEVAKEMKEHSKTCPMCVARARFLDEHFGPMPALPAPPWLRIFGLIAAIPSWARPAAIGAIALGAITMLRILAALPLLLSNPAKVGEALVAVLAAACAGAAGGAIYSLARPVLRKLGRVGDYLTGIVCVFAYMGALALVAPYAFGERLVNGRGDLAMFAILSAFFGLFIGHSWFRERTAD